MLVQVTYLPDSPGILKFCQSSLFHGQHNRVLAPHGNLRWCATIRKYTISAVFSPYRCRAFLHGLLGVFYLEQVSIWREYSQCTVVFPAHGRFSLSLYTLHMGWVSPGSRSERGPFTAGWAGLEYCNPIGQRSRTFAAKTKR